VQNAIRLTAQLNNRVIFAVVSGCFIASGRDTDKGLEGVGLRGRGWGKYSSRVFIGGHSISCFADLRRFGNGRCCVQCNEAVCLICGKCPINVCAFVCLKCKLMIVVLWCSGANSIQ
jgi:hypothetical protein